MKVMIQRGADGVLYVTYPEKLDEKIILEYLKDLETELEKSPEKTKILTDTMSCQNINMEQMKNIAEAVKPLKKYIDKSAIIVTSNFQKTAANTVFIISKRFDIKIFGNREDALAWLKEK